MPHALLRDATEADVSFIFNSWLKSYLGSTATKGIPGPVYFDAHHKVIEALLVKCKVTVLCDAKDNSQIFGYLVYEVVDEVPVVHYAYIKHVYRKLGLLKMLLSDAKLGKETSLFYSHNTDVAYKISKNTKWIYNPYLAYGVK
jgi:hypothetical protein